MSREEALEQTEEQFTNLLDGSILPNATIEEIIEYYESLLNNKSIDTHTSISNIEANFIEAEIEEMANEADYWDGDASYQM